MWYTNGFKMREYEFYWARIEGTRVFGDVLLVCMCFGCVKLNFLLDEEFCSESCTSLILSGRSHMRPPSSLA